MKYVCQTRQSKLNSCVLLIVLLCFNRNSTHTDISLAGGLNGKVIDHTHTLTNSLQI